MDEMERARLVAYVALAGQEQSDGPAFDHAERVALSLPDGRLRAIGYLHDVVEDTAVTLRDLNELGFDPVTRHAVEALTRQAEEPYHSYIERVAAAGPVATEVKLADLRENLRRCQLVGSGYEGLAARYRRAIDALTTAADAALVLESA